MGPSNIDESRELMDKVLKLLREERDSRQRGTGAREIAEAITNFETGCMWMIRSEFAEEPYSPLLRLKKAE